MKLRTRHYLLTVVFILAIAMRLYMLDSRQLGLDESWVIETAQMKSVEVIIKSAAENITPPLYYVIGNALFNLTQSLFAVKMLSILASLVTVLICYLVAKNFFGTKTAILSAFLLAINPFYLAHSQNLRPYAILPALFLLIFFCLWKFLQTSNKKWAIFTAFFNVVLLYTHYYGVFIVFAEALFLYLMCKGHKPLIRPFVIAILVPALIFAPWIFYVILNPPSVEASEPWVKFETPLHDFGYVIYKFSVGANVRLLLKENPALMFAFPLSIILMFLGLFSVYKRNPAFLKAIGCLVAAPFLIGYLLSFFVRTFNVRYLIFSLPLLIILIAHAIFGIKNKQIKFAAVAILIGLWLWLDSIYYSLMTKPDWNIWFGL